MLKIGNIDIERSAALAPMAGVTDQAFRVICKEFGAAYLVTEMASAKAMTMGDKKTPHLLELDAVEHPVAIQLFGEEPEVMAQAAKLALSYSPDIIDINMGCPAPKIATSGSGSALMKTPELAGQIVRAVRNAVDIPVTVKFRKGWDEEHVNAVEFAQILEENGADALTIHGRTRKQMYAPPVDIDIIRQVKQAVSIPVIGNGDIDSAQSAVSMYEQTGCDLVMIGRGALGKPWLFSQVKQYLQNGTLPPEPDIEEKMQVMLRHIALTCELKGEYIGMKECRKHASWYMKGMRGAAVLREESSHLSTFEDAKRLAQHVLEKAAHGVE